VGVYDCVGIFVDIFTFSWAFLLFVVGVCTLLWALINTVGIFLIVVGVFTSLWAFLLFRGHFYI
jgi:hypothetical protein